MRSAHIFALQHVQDDSVGESQIDADALTCCCHPHQTTPVTSPIIRPDESRRIDMSTLAAVYCIATCNAIELRATRRDIC